MFTTIYLQNYKTFTDTYIDLSANSNKAKPLVLLYGENGAGKSNFASVFFCFVELIRTMDVRDMFQDIMENYKEAANNDSLLQMLKRRFRDIETIIKESKTIGSAGNMVLDFSFVINEKKGRYIIETDDTEIVHERLEYTLDKNKGVFFDIYPGKARLNEKVFLNKSIQDDIFSNIARFWGKHSLLAIINHEFGDKSRNFLENAFSDNFRRCLSDFYFLSCRIRKPNTLDYDILGLSHHILSQIEAGQIRNEELAELEKTERMLQVFLPKINSEIKQVRYDTEIHNDSVTYQLYTQQLIAGELIEVPFTLESTGTHNLIRLLPFFLNASKGYTVIIDEIDSGIHDLLVQYILEDISKEIEGQMIVTTHNTLIMKSSEIPNSAFYTIEKDNQGFRNIKCITSDASDRIHPNHNKQRQYTEGAYHAIPSKPHLSLKELYGILE